MMTIPIHMIYMTINDVYSGIYNPQEHMTTSKYP